MTKHKLRLGKNKTSRLISSLSIAIISIVGAAVLVFSRAATPPSSSVMAGNAKYYIESAQTTYNKDATLTVSIFAESAQAFTAADLDLTYTSTQLQILPTNPISTTGSKLPICPDKITSTVGKVTLLCSIDRANILGGGEQAPVTGKNLVATVSFKVLAGSGTTQLKINKESANRSAIIADTTDGSRVNIWDGTSGVLNLTLGNGGGGSGGGSSGGSSSGGTSSTTPKTTTTTTTTPKSGTSTSSKPVATNTQNKQSTSTPQSTTTTTQPPIGAEASGFILAIKVLNTSGKPVVGASVTIESQNSITDSTGIASFTNIAAGKHKVSVNSKEGKVLSDITVNGSGSATEVQQFDVKLKKSFPVIYLRAIPILVTVGLIIKFILNRRAPWKRHSGPSATTANITPSSPISGSSAIGPSVADTPPVPSITAPAAEVIKPQPVSAPKPAPVTTTGAAGKVVVPSDKPAAPVSKPQVPPTQPV